VCSSSLSGRAILALHLYPSTAHGFWVSPHELRLLVVTATIKPTVSTYKTYTMIQYPLAPVSGNRPPFSGSHANIQNMIKSGTFLVTKYSIPL